MSRRQSASNHEIGRLIGGWLRSLDPERARTGRDSASSEPDGTLLFEGVLNSTLRVEPGLELGRGAQVEQGISEGLELFERQALQPGGQD